MINSTRSFPEIKVYWVTEYAPQNLIGYFKGTPILLKQCFPNYMVWDWRFSPYARDK